MTKGIVVTDKKRERLYVVEIENESYYYCPTGLDFQMISKGCAIREVEICEGCGGVGYISIYNPDVDSEFDTPCETCEGKGYVA